MEQQPRRRRRPWQSKQRQPAEHSGQGRSARLEFEPVKEQLAAEELEDLLGQIKFARPHAASADERIWLITLNDLAEQGGG